LLNGTLRSGGASTASRAIDPEDLGMGYEPTAPVSLGRTGVVVTRLGFGTAEIGGLYRAVSDADGAAMVGHAWDLGVRYFDTAPLYGYGNAERRLGAGLRDRPRAGFVVSSKVGRILVDRDAVPAGADVDRQSEGETDDAFYKDTPPVRVIFDYSGDGIRRSIEASLMRLGLDRIDIAYIHDPDDHWQDAIDAAYPALHRLRAEGVLRAIGAGMNQSAMLARFARETDMDVFLLAGRYTLLDQDALGELLPLCLERGIAIVAGGIMNSGLLADPRPGGRFNYAPAPPDVVRRAQRLRSVCDGFGIPLRAAAIQFPLAHPAVAALVAGVRTVDHLDEYPAMMQLPIPADLWLQLKAQGLLAAEAPVPA
jgi:D-threo-aldose 1-dehydrogenase